MIYLESVMLASLCSLGVYCSWMDIHTQRIPNKAILLSLGAGICLHLVYIILWGTAYYVDWLLEMLIADMIAFVLYLNQVWAPGDVKLFSASYFLVPPRILDMFSLQHAVTPFLLIFSLALLYVLMDTFIRLIRREKWKASPLPDKSVLFFRLIQTLIISSGMFYLILLFFHESTGQNGLFVSFAVMMYVFTVSDKPFFRKWQILLMHLIPIFLYWITHTMVIPIPDWQTLLILCVMFLVKQLAARFNYQCIPTSSIQPGMVLSADTVSLFFSSKVQDLPLDISENLSARISDKNAEAVKRWEKTAKGKSEIWIVRKMPFAIMIFIGFLAWIMIRLWR